ncbi:MAG TPA: IPT/TIG domain-containing protein [Candidatus Acidoferrales bacterium]|nr:IPT/TIG domain-containing protein [Candidatus Acidoferrales bacterium]
MPTSVRRHVSLRIAIAMAFLLSGCAVFNISKPSANGQANCPVPAEVDWGASLQANTFKVALDSTTDVTNQFTIGTTSSGGSAATANLTIPQGSHSLLASGKLWTWYTQAYEFTSTTVNFTVNPPALNLSPSPNPLNVPVGGQSTLSVNVTAGACLNGPVAVTLGGLPNQVTATGFNVSLSGGSGNGTTTVKATSSASPAHSTANVSGTAASGQTASANFTLNVGSAPHVNSVSPAMQTRGGSVTISGSNFDTVCANDVVSIGGATATPSSCSASSLSVSVPQQASFVPNPGLLTVKTGAGTSSGINFTVARQPGAFVEITSSIEGQVSNQTCSTGAVKLTICSSNCGSNYPFVATFEKAPNGPQINQPIPFHKDNSRVSGLGGAGFSLCTVGVVLDGDTTGVSPQLLGIEFLDLVTANHFPSGGTYTFNYGVPAGNASYVPRIFRSPDGTILILASASTIGPSQLTAAVFDQENPNGAVNANCQSSIVSSSFSASITSSNQVSITLAGSPCSAVVIH